MRRRNNPIPLEHQRPRQIHIGFADEEFEEQEKHPTVYVWDRNCNGETYENLDLRHIEFWNEVTEGSSLVGTSFINCDLRGCSFNTSYLLNTNFQGSDLSGSKFDSGLRNTNFESCNLSGAEFGYHGDFLSCNWNNTNIEGATFRNKEFILFFFELKRNPNPSMNMHGTPKFEFAYLFQANLQGADLQGAYLREANLRGANLQSANLQGADLRGANLQWADLQGANLQGADLQDAYYDDNTEGLTDKQRSVMKHAEDEDEDDD